LALLSISLSLPTTSGVFFLLIDEMATTSHCWFVPKMNSSKPIYHAQAHLFPDETFKELHFNWFPKIQQDLIQTNCSTFWQF